jgi:hypothetical protein
VAGLGVGVDVVAVADVLGQVLGEVADAPAGVAGSGEDAEATEVERMEWVPLASVPGLMRRAVR